MSAEENPTTADIQLSDLQKTTLEYVVERLKKEKDPQRTLTILHLRFKLGKSLDKIEKHVGVGRERIRQIARVFITQIAQDLNIKAEDAKKVLANLPLNTEAEGLLTATPESVLPRRAISVPEIFGILCQHILFTPTELRIVKAPVLTLKARTGLTLEEAHTVLKDMCKKKLIKGTPPWNIIEIIPEVAIPEFRGYSTRGGPR